MKRVFAFLITLVLALFVVSCGSNNDPGKNNGQTPGANGDITNGTDTPIVEIT